MLTSFLRKPILNASTVPLKKIVTARTVSKILMRMSLSGGGVLEIQRGNGVKTQRENTDRIPRENNKKNPQKMDMNTTRNPRETPTKPHLSFWLPRLAFASNQPSAAWFSPETPDEIPTLAASAGCSESPASICTCSNGFKLTSNRNDSASFKIDMSPLLSL